MSAEGETWGTFYHITYKSRRPLDDSIKAVLRQVDAELSMFNPSSTVSRINSGETDLASDWVARIMESSMRTWQLSGGRFDPTVGPLTDLWGFGTSEVHAQPDSLAVAEALGAVGLGHCYVDADGAVHKKRADTRFDFSALAKGFGVDMLGDMLERNGCKDYLVEVGGEITAKGLSPRGDKWRVQIDAPIVSADHNRLTVVELGPNRTSLATSGNYRNFRTFSDSISVGHTINPLTGFPVQTSTLSASVISVRCVDADAMATACMTMEPDSAIVLADRAGVRALIVRAAGDDVEILANY